MLRSFIWYMLVGQILNWGTVFFVIWSVLRKCRGHDEVLRVLNQKYSSCGKTSPALSPPTEGTTSRPSSKRSSGSPRKTRLRCLRLNRDAGPPQIYTWATDGALRTEYSTHNTGESPSAENASFLSRILQAGVPRKYYLTAKACQGILRRASVRGKELPTVLKLALERQAKEGT